MNREAWLAAIASVGPKPDPDALTTREFAQLVGLQLTAAKERLRRLVLQGRARSGHKQIIDSAGRVQTVIAYRLIEETPDVRDRHVVASVPKHKRL